MPRTLAADALTFALFGPLEAEERAALAPLLRPRRFEAGRAVFQRGDPSEELLLVISGSLRVCVCSLDGRVLAFRVAVPGDVVGEIGALDGGPRSADVVAARNCEALALSRADLQRLLASRPAMALGVVRFLCRRLRETSEQLEARALQRVEARLARFLSRLTGGFDVDGAGREVELKLGVSQSEIAELIGASRPKVSLAFGALEEQGAIRREGKTLFCRPATLAALAED